MILFILLAACVPMTTAAESDPLDSTSTEALFFQFLQHAQKGEGEWSESADDPVEVKVATTALCVRTFLGSGYDHAASSRYRSTVGKGLSYLLAHQSADGDFSVDTAEHSIATIALTYAFALSADPELKDAAKRGMNVLLTRRSIVDGQPCGWKGFDGSMDTWTNVWAMLACHSAHSAHVDVSGGSDAVKQWVAQSWHAVNPESEKLDPYTAITHFPAYISDVDGHIIPSLAKSDEAGAMCAAYAGFHADTVILNTLGNSTLSNMKIDLIPPLPRDSFRSFAATLALYQIGGDRWRQWNAPHREFVYDSQARTGASTGLWPSDHVRHGRLSGDIITSALTMLSLEVYMEYEQPLRIDRLEPDYWTTHHP